MAYNRQTAGSFEGGRGGESEEIDLRREMGDQSPEGEAGPADNNAVMNDLRDKYGERSNLEELSKLALEPAGKENEKNESYDPAELDEARKRLEKMLEPTKEEIEENEKMVKNIINKRGVSIKGSTEVVKTGNMGEMLAQKQRFVNLMIDSLERKALNLPEKEGVKDVKKFEPDIRKIEEEITKSKERFVEKFIEKSVEAVLEHFDKEFKESENGKNAKDLVELKTEEDIRRAARSFIEGGKPDFGFWALMEITSFEENGENVQYITGYTVEIKGSKDQSVEKSTAGGQPLVSSSGREKIFGKRMEEGGVEKEIKE